MNTFRVSTTLCLIVALCFIAGATGYTVSGNKIKDPNGNQVLLRGVDRPSFEWNAQGENANARDYQLMAGWGANVVRIATNQDFWLSNSAYATTIDQQVTWARAAGLGVILDLHWNNGGQQNMADKNSITYWSQVAARYKSNPWVMFELYNEPHDISWSQWLNGDGTYAGMQQLYNAVRGAGANNTVICGGLNWAFDLSGVSSGYAVQGVNIAYATHPYDYGGKQSGDWDNAFGKLSTTAPVIMTEFGQYCNTDTYVADLLTYAQNKQIHWTAWAWYVNGCSFPSIIADWNGTPISGVGELVKSYLSGKTSSSPSTTAPTSAPTAPPSASGALTVYAGGIQSNWQDWSWSTAYSLADSSLSYGGSGKSIRFQVTSYQGIYLHYTSYFSIGAYSTLNFYVNGGASSVGAANLGVQVYSYPSNVVVGSALTFPLAATANQWTLISIPISSFGISAATQISGLAIVSKVGNSVGTIYIDQISFVPASPVGVSTQPPTQPATQAPTQPPTQPATPAPTQPPTQPATPAPTQPATPAPTHAPTQPPTQPATPAPTQPATPAPTRPPTAAPTQPATLPPATPAPTSAPSGCSAASIGLTQTVATSWNTGTQTITQYTLSISSTCPGKTLTSLTLAATGWNPISSWNVNVAASANGNAVLTMPSYFNLIPGQVFQVGYQNPGPQASFTVSAFTFQ